MFMLRRFKMVKGREELENEYRETMNFIGNSYIEIPQEESREMIKRITATGFTAMMSSTIH